MNLLAKTWTKQLPGTRTEFAKFLGVSLEDLRNPSWENLSELAGRRLGLIPLGGGIRFQGSDLEEKTWRFALPHRERWIRAGVPRGGARLDRASDHCRFFQGRGATLEAAALAALLVAWELTYLRAGQVAR